MSETVDIKKLETITFSVPLVAIQAAIEGSVQTVLNGLFTSSRMPGALQGVGFKIAEKAIITYMESMSLPPSAIARIEAVIEEVLPKAVEAAVKNRAGTMMAEIIRSGALDEKISQVIEARLIEARGGGVWA
jgi:hypothetical protein